MVIGGTIGVQQYSPKTFYFDALKNVWSNGPALITGRQSHGCGRIAVSSSNTVQTVIVAGGDNGGILSSVEILDGTTNTWRAGRKSSSKKDHQ
jgi:hypothetical protein